MVSAPLFAQRARRAAGYTLVEVMATLALISAAGLTFTQSLRGQKELIMLQMDKTESLQNARAALSYIENQLHRSAWGLVSGGYGNAGYGVVAVGGCGHADAASSGLFAYNTCDCGPAPNTCKSDRARLVSIDPARQAQVTASFDLNNNDPILVQEFTGALAPGALVAVSGLCQHTGQAVPFTQLRQITASSYNASLNIATYNTKAVNFGQDPQGDALSCAGAYTVDTDFVTTLGPAHVVDLFVDRTDADHPSLKARLWTADNAYQQQVIAYDVDDLQFIYGIADAQNLTQAAQVSAWCHLPGDDASCQVTFADSAVSMTARQRLDRILAVQVAVVTRSRFWRQVRVSDPVPAALALTPWNASVLSSGDGFARYVFRSTVVLRNRNL